MIEYPRWFEIFYVENQHFLIVEKKSQLNLSSIFNAQLSYYPLKNFAHLHFAQRLNIFNINTQILDFIIHVQVSKLHNRQNLKEKLWNFLFQTFFQTPLNLLNREGKLSWSYFGVKTLPFFTCLVFDRTEEIKTRFEVLRHHLYLNLDVKLKMMSRNSILYTRQDLVFDFWM